jgi:hypothetical protein
VWAEARLGSTAGELAQPGLLTQQDRQPDLHVGHQLKLSLDILPVSSGRETAKQVVMNKLDGQKQEVATGAVLWHEPEAALGTEHLIHNQGPAN